MPLLESPRSAVTPEDEAPPILDDGADPPFDHPHDDGFGGGGGDDDDGDDEPDFYDARRPWVTLATFWHPAEAHIARLRLESAGVACVILDELTAATHVFAIAVGGVKLQVPLSQRPLAARLLHQAGSDPEGGGPVTLARFARLVDAKAAACVVEAAGIDCRVVALADPAALHAFVGRLVPMAWRHAVAPIAAVRVEREALRAAAEALGGTRLGAGLTRRARGHCR